MDYYKYIMCDAFMIIHLGILSYWWSF